jgi:predicted MFS family arabinose efflux permease
LLVVYYAGRGGSVLLLAWLVAPHTEPGTRVLVILFGVVLVATVPPTIVLCRNYFGARSPVVFGWVFAFHQLGAAVAAAGAGWLRDLQGTYDLAFYLAAGLCVLAALLCLNVRNVQVSTA